jgi:hypothetical protein
MSNLTTVLLEHLKIVHWAWHDPICRQPCVTRELIRAAEDQIAKDGPNE